MKNIKVLLSDPRHDTVGAHSSFMPSFFLHRFTPIGPITKPTKDSL